MTSLPRFLSDNIFGNLVGNSSSAQASPPTGVSRGFELFIQTINKSRNKYEENQVVQRELQTLQQNISTPNVSQVQMRDLLCRLVYSHMLGYNVSWGYIHAVKLAQQGTQASKKMGYLTCCLLLHRDHDLILLLINTIQKDLKSSNLLDNMAALSAASQLVPTEMIPTLLPVVLEKLKHPRGFVRQRAIMCLHQFYVLAPELLSHNLPEIRKMILDKDAGVVGTYLHILQLDIQRVPDQHQATGTVLLKILSQLSTSKLDPMFDYHGMPFPWLRIHLIRCLTILASTHHSIRKPLASVLEMIMQRVTLKENIAFALLYECILCIVTINPGQKLLTEAAKHVSRFLKSNDPNLKLIGVKALVRLVQADKQYATEYQDLIVQSLEHADTSIQRKMYKVLYEISHAGNVEAISAKMLQQMSFSNDRYWRSEVVTMVIDMATRYSDNTAWQIDTLFTCLHLGARDVDIGIVETIFATLDKGYMATGSDLKKQQVLVQKAVGALAAKDATPLVTQVAVWVLGELCSMLKNISEERLLGLVIKHVCNTKLTYHVKSYILSALEKLLCAHVTSHVTLAAHLRECLQVMQHPVIKQRLLVLLAVCQAKGALRWHPEKTIDTTLSFLDDYVSDQLEQGGTPYRPTHLRTSATVSSKGDVPVYNTEPSEERLDDSEERLSVDRPRTCSTTSSTKTADDREIGLNVSGVKKVWSKQGRREEMPDKPVTMATPQDHTESEDERRFKELSSALFAGLPSKEKYKPEEATSPLASGFLFSDDKGWRHLHETTKGANTLLDLSSPLDNPHSSTSNTQSQYSSNRTAINDPFKTDTVQLDSEQSELVCENGNDQRQFSVDDDGLLKSEDTRSLGFERSEAASSFQMVDRTEDELSTLMNDNSGFLNISVCSNDESKVSLSYLGDDVPSELLGEVSMLNASNNEEMTGDMTATSHDSNGPKSAKDKTSADENITERNNDSNGSKSCVDTITADENVTERTDIDLTDKLGTDVDQINYQSNKCDK